MIEVRPNKALQWTGGVTPICGSIIQSPAPELGRSAAEGVPMVPHPKATVFATSPEEAAKGALSVVADGRTAADMSGIRAESVAALQYVLLGQSYELGEIDLSILKGHDQVYVYTEMHGGWLFRFPDEVVRMLAAVPDSRLGSSAQAWSLVFQEDGLQPIPGEFEGMFRQLVTIARSAVDLHLSMYWLQEGC